MPNVYNICLASTLVYIPSIYTSVYSYKLGKILHSPNLPLPCILSVADCDGDNGHDDEDEDGDKMTMRMVKYDGDMRILWCTWMRAKNKDNKSVMKLVQFIKLFMNMKS